MITILNDQYRPEAVLDDYWNDEISEQINGAYTFKFTVCIDEEKSQHIQVGNYVEAEGQYFNIVKHRRTRNEDGSVIIAVECEQVSYDLLFHLFEGGYIHTGTPSTLLGYALDGTGFSIGDVELTDLISVDLKEGVSARAVLMEIALQSGGELLFDKYTVSLQARRGQDRGVQFSLGKNLKGIVKDVNGQSGEVLTAYEIDVIELNSLPEFEGLEYFELGDTVQIVDEELGINEEQRIIQYSYSPKRRINSKVTIANYISGIQDTIYRIQTSTVGKDKWMYGVKIGPSDGVVIERYDKLAKSIFNADEFRMQKGNGNGSYTDSLYFDPINQQYEFTGVVRAGQFIGGSIQIGSNFSVNNSGHMRAVGAEFSGTITGSAFIGGSITIGEGNNVFKADTSGIWAGNSIFATAPFKVGMNGKLTATGADLSGGNITGAANIAVSSNMSIGGRLTMNTASFFSELILASGVMLYADPASASLQIYAGGGVYANGVQIG